MADTDAAMDDFAPPVDYPTPVEQVRQMIAGTEDDVERHARNLKASKELLKRQRAVLEAMLAGPGA